MISFVFNPFTSNFDTISTVTLGTPNGLSLAGQVLSLALSSTSTTGALSSTDWNTFNGKQPAGNYITALTGDGTASGPGSAALTLATVNTNVGAFGSSTSIPSFTVNAKGLITAASGNVVIAPAGTLTGTTLASNVVTSSLTSVGVQAQALDMGSHKINNVTDPTSAQDAATKAYVDNIAAGINPAVAVQAATTSASNTSSFTYNNGVSGVGATLTGAVNTALTVDGYTFTALGQRLLVKNDTQSPSGAFNGVYYVTQVQTSLLPLILTRALDYDMPSDINNTGAIPVINGTVNGTTQWVLTSLVNTVGTDPLTFTEFARNPADYLLKANNLSDVASASTSFNNLSPVTSTGDLIIGNGTNSNTRLAKGSQYQTLQTGASTLGWDAVHLDQSAAITGTLPVGNGGTGQTSYTDGQLLIGKTTGNTLNKATLTAGSGITVTNGSGTITIAATASAATAPTVQKFTSGSGTYTTPTSPAPLYIRVQMVGGGGGGGGSGTSGSGGNGGDGGSTTFGTSLLNCGGGGHGTGGTPIPGTGSSVSLGTGPVGLAFVGGNGGTVGGGVGGQFGGGVGGVSPFGGAGSGAYNSSTGIDARTNTGSGGGGGPAGSASGCIAGGAGAAGSYIDAIITSPAATYAYAVGASGSAGTAGTSGFVGGAGAAGIIIVWEHYQ